MRNRFISLLFIFLLFSISIIANSEIDSLFGVLDRVMTEQSTYDSEKEQRLSEIKNLLADTSLNAEEGYFINKQLINEYEPYDFDSTLSYVERNIQLAEQLASLPLQSEARLVLARLLNASGRHKESVDILQTIDKNILAEDLLIQYFLTIIEVNQELSINSTLKENTAKYVDVVKMYSDSLLLLLDSNSEKYLEIKENDYRSTGHLLESKQINSQRLALAKPGTRDYSIVTYQRSQIYEAELNIEQQKKYLILSAISDIRQSIKDNASLTTLALILQREGDIDRAYRYITFSMDDALFYNSHLRFLALSTILPYITEDYQLKIDRQNKRLRNSLIIISLLTLVLLFAVLFIYKQISSLSAARNKLRINNKQFKELNKQLTIANESLYSLNHELSESNHVKEQYIAHFLTICSNYLDKLDAYRKMVNKQIANRKVQELFDMTNAKGFFDDEIKEFYTNFDSTFLSIYPNFVEELNALLISDEQIELKNGELLNTELRIFALIRLGISDSSKIAGLLRYSVNTIYNYRVKVKNKAAGDREAFENNIMRIGTFSS